MDKTFKPAEVEESLYKQWEEKGLLSPKSGKPYTILMPPPNANASLHAGHGMYTADDIMIRYMRLRGFASLWIPGMDHAGIETQYVYEKHLTKQGKSRMDFDRKTLYGDIFEFVKSNSGLIYQQFKKLGFLADWNRSVYTLDPHVISKVYDTFKKMESEGLVYKSDYLVSYCVHDGTSLAELEIRYVERKDNLYYVRYPLVSDSSQCIVVATTRPEPIFVDTHLAVNPEDKKHKNLIGQKVCNPLTGVEMEIIADDFVDPEFGTGIVKLTPAHDQNDFEAAKKHNLPIIQAIDLNGRLVESAGKYKGMKVKVARESIVKDLQEKNLIEKIDSEYVHSVGVCYKCGRDLELLTIPNWYLKVEDLKKNIIDAVKKNKVKFQPVRHKKQMLQWLEMMHDWPISRQNVWGIRIPVWYEVVPGASNIVVWWIDKNKKADWGPVDQFLNKGISLKEIEEGLQKVYAMPGDSAPKYVVSDKKPGENYLPETDTFDTWFSSGQWPLVTLKDDEFKTRFPTDMMGTLSDILRFWISRMIMFSLYDKNEVPFKTVYLWSLVADSKGAKMSKSKGNVVNPIDLVEKYGADAFRATLFFGIAQGGTVNLSEDKVRAMRNFANKVWNIGRFLEMNKGSGHSDTDKMSGEESGGALPSVAASFDSAQDDEKNTTNDKIKELKKEFESMEKEFHKNMKDYKFSAAFGLMYEFVWHRFADFYIEQLKEELRNDNIEVRDSLTKIYLESLKLLHPFVPFITDAVYKQFTNKFILE